MSFDEDIRHSVRHLEKDYHVLITYGDDIETFKFECFNPADGIKDIDLEELKQRLNVGEPEGST